ncbi:MAG TPA: ATP-binding protein, partial [Actinoplanes sp.]|nr:ATP-binding protein [Actinoplanes sp.]
EVDRAAYRIVQEALTNVRKHAAPDAKAEVTVDYGRAELRLSIRNDGSVTGEPGGDGSGITGMRARAEALGGTLLAGPVPSGGFLVTATLPAGAAGAATRTAGVATGTAGTAGAATGAAGAAGAATSQAGETT